MPEAPLLPTTITDVAMASKNEPLLPKDITDLEERLAEEFGTAKDDRLDTNETLEEFMNRAGSINFYTYTALMVLDPDEKFEHWRSYFKVFLLPAIQILVPLGACWYFIVEKELVKNHGYCVNHSNIIFRSTGFFTFIYSAWQIIDGREDETAKFFLMKAVQQYSLTGRSTDLKEAWFFWLGDLSQQLCAFFLALLCWVVYVSQSDTPLDLMMNCVAVNFVLDIDSQWISEGQQLRSKTLAKNLFKRYRDVCVNNKAEVIEGLEKNKRARRQAPGRWRRMINAADRIITVFVYFLVFGWTFCPSEY